MNVVMGEYNVFKKKQMFIFLKSNILDKMFLDQL